MDLIQKLVDELKLARLQVEGVVALLKEDASVPFIARYRKERTGGLNEVDIFAIKDRLKYLDELEQRKIFVLKTVTDAGKLTPDFQTKVENSVTKAELEDLFMPYRARKRTRSSAAKQKGLEPLADLIWKQEVISGNVEELVKPFINPDKGVKDIAEALAGARDIIAERVSENADCRKTARDLLLSEGKVTAKARDGVELSKGKFANYARFSEPLAKIPSHRILAVMRGASEKQLSLVIETPREKILQEIKTRIITNPDALLRPDLALGIEESFDRLLSPSLDNEIRQELKRRADLEAIDVFAKNIRALLLQAPLGEKSVLAIDPGIRTGCKTAILDHTGKLLAHSVLFLDKSEDERKQAAEQLARLIKEHQVSAIAIGNGTGGREADVFVKEVLKANELSTVVRVMVNESGASIYSASPIAREEFPDLDLTARGTVSIGRRLQDPLAELVKLDPKSIGVGQYQHDVDQVLLRQKLEDVVESCVNFVGVDVNTASPALLRYVAGIGPKLAKSVIEARALKGGFKSREDLLEIAGLGPKAFEQCAGFLRIRGSANPLDNSAVHPESYPLVEQLALSLESSVKDLIGNTELIGKLDLGKFSVAAGEYTLKDIVEELKKPGRDPRSTFVNPEFSDEIHQLSDLKEGMVLNGVITNLTAFGAFVDVGVHQDGLVHISAITHKFIRDPLQALTVGQHVKVKVVSVDVDRKRIGFSMKALEAPPVREVRRPKVASGVRPPRRNPVASSGSGSTTAVAASAGETQQQPGTTRSAVALSSPGSRSGSGERKFTRAARPARTFLPGSSTPPRGTSSDSARVGSVTALPSAAGSIPAESSGSGTLTAGTLDPRTGKSAFRGARERQGSRSDKGAGRGGPPRRNEPGEKREVAKPLAPGAPDYSKFFVKSKPKEREKKRVSDSGASRDEVRQLLRQQQTGGTSMADLLRKAGVVDGKSET